MDNFAIDFDTALDELEQQELENEQKNSKSNYGAKYLTEISPKIVFNEYTEITNKHAENQASIQNIDQLDDELLEIINSSIVENEVLFSKPNIKNTDLNILSRTADDIPNVVAMFQISTIDGEKIDNDCKNATDDPPTTESCCIVNEEEVTKKSYITQSEMKPMTELNDDSSTSANFQINSYFQSKGIVNKDFEEDLISSQNEDSIYFDTFESPRTKIVNTEETDNIEASIKCITEEKDIENSSNELAVRCEPCTMNLEDNSQESNNENLIDIEPVGYNYELTNTDEFNSELERELNSLVQNDNESIKIEQQNIESSDSDYQKSIVETQKIEQIVNYGQTSEQIDDAVEVAIEQTTEIENIENPTDDLHVEENVEKEVSEEQDSFENETNEPGTSRTGYLQSNEQPTVHNNIEVIDFETEWSQISHDEKMLGLIAPTWLDDAETDSCMKCSVKFTFRTRRHHCRACGLIFCSNCCYIKIGLPYTMSKSTVENTDTESGSKSRVCNDCNNIIKKVDELRSNIQKMPKITTKIVSVLKKKNVSEQANIISTG